MRGEAVIKIQKHIRRYLVRRKAKEILLKEKLNYPLTYPFEAQKVQLKIYINHHNIKFYNFVKCPLRKYFVLYINRLSLKPGKYLCHLLVNDSIIFDGRYKYTEGEDGKIYNVIEFGADDDISSSSSVLKSISVESRPTDFSKTDSSPKIKDKYILQEILSTNSVSSSRKAYSKKLKKNLMLNPKIQTSNTIIQSKLFKFLENRSFDGDDKDRADLFSQNTFEASNKVNYTNIDDTNVLNNVNNGFQNFDSYNQIQSIKNIGTNLDISKIPSYSKKVHLTQFNNYKSPNSTLPKGTKSDKMKTINAESNTLKTYNLNNISELTGPDDLQQIHRKFISLYKKDM